jgi:type VI protein secretion system component VasF
MAQINIERKKTPVWPWILALILLALIAWAIYEFVYDRDQTEVYEEEIPATGMVVTPEAYWVPA